MPSMLSTFSALYVASVITGAQAMLHYANFVRALVPWSRLMLTAHEERDSEEYNMLFKHAYQGHALRPWNDKFDGLRLDFLNDLHPFDLNLFAPENINKHHLGSAQHKADEKTAQKEKKKNQQVQREREDSQPKALQNQPLFEDINVLHGVETAIDECKQENLEESRFPVLQSHKGSGDDCSWKVLLQARADDEQSVYMEQQTMSEVRTAYQIDECALLKLVVASRVGQDPRQLNCRSIFEQGVFVSAAVSVHLPHESDSKKLHALENHAMLNPIGEVFVECSC
jgi:hypothetical protein